MIFIELGALKTLHIGAMFVQYYSIGALPKTNPKKFRKETKENINLLNILVVLQPIVPY